MTFICPATENIIATNQFPFDTIIEIGGVKYRVADRMNRRYKNNIDILLSDRKEALKKGRHLSTVYILDK